jgi:hypothetical protein
LQAEDELAAELQDFLTFRATGVGIDHNSLLPLQYWSRYAERFPNLLKVASKFLVLQPTSAESERTFSMAEIITTGLIPFF